MIEQTLTVKATEGLVAFLVPEEKKACEGCNGKCGSQVFAKLFDTKKADFEYKFDTPLSVGQKVVLALDERHLVKTSLLIYLLPLVFAICSAIFAAEVMHVAELYQILLAALGGFTGYLIAKSHLKSVKHHIEVVKIYPNSLPVTQIDGD